VASASCIEQHVYLAIRDPVSRLDRREAERLRQVVALAGAGRAEQERVLVTLDEAGGGEVEDEGPVHLRVEVEATLNGCGIAEARLLDATGEQPILPSRELVVLTDRNDLDDQLFGSFARCRDLLRQDPVQAADRADLRPPLIGVSGGVVFTTIQKFLPEEKGDRHPVLSQRRNIVVIADEAHRSHYDLIDGFARTCATRCRTRRSSASPELRSSRPTPTRAPSSVATSASMIFNAR
jgi:type I restriction enzyme R subunit